MQTVVTHDGSFHPDDVLAIASIKLFLNDEPVEIIRTRDKERIIAADWAVDVGEEYDPDIKNRTRKSIGCEYQALGLLRFIVESKTEYGCACDASCVP